MSQFYPFRSLVIGLVFLCFNSCSTGEVQLEKSEFNFRTMNSSLNLEKLDDLYGDADLLFLNQVLSDQEKEQVYDGGYFIFSDNREVSMISKRPFTTYKNWLMPTVPGRQVPGIISQLAYEFSGGRELALFIVTLNDQVDLKDVARRSQMVDKLYLSISGSALLVVSSDDQEYNDTIQRRISSWEIMKINGGDYTLYSSNVRDWKMKYTELEIMGLSSINARSFQKEKMGMSE